MISIAQLEPKPRTDPFGRQEPGLPLAVIVEGDEEEWKSFEIGPLNNSRVRRYGRGKQMIEYLINWKGTGPEYSEWYPRELLDHAKELVDDYDASHLPIDLVKEGATMSKRNTRTKRPTVKLRKS